MTHRSQKQHDYDARLKALELEVARIREELQSLREDDPPVGSIGTLKIPGPPSKRRGRKPTIDGWVFLDRDELVSMLEYYWPEISPFCKKLHPQGLRRVLGFIAKSPETERARAAQHLLTHFDILQEVLKSDRFRGDPRQVANALAGVPKVSWWRSLKVCGERPCARMIDNRAICDYLQRKRPQVYKRLKRANGDVVRISVELRNVRSADPLVFPLQHSAQYAAQVWAAKEPNYPILLSFRRTDQTVG